MRIFIITHLQTDKNVFALRCTNIILSFRLRHGFSHIRMVRSPSQMSVLTVHEAQGTNGHKHTVHHPYCGYVSLWPTEGGNMTVIALFVNALTSHTHFYCWQWKWKNLCGITCMHHFRDANKQKPVESKVCIQARTGFSGQTKDVADAKNHKRTLLGLSLENC